MEGHRRLSLSDQMSAATEERRSSLAGLTLDAVLGGEKRPEPQTPRTPQTPAHGSRTLLDIIRDEEPNKGEGDKKSWKIFRDRLRLKRAGAAWISSVHTPTSDILLHTNNSRSPYSARNTRVRFVTNSSSSNPDESTQHHLTRPEDFSDSVPVSDPPIQISRPVMTRRGSTRMFTSHSESSQPPDDSLDIPMPADAPPARSFRPQISRHNSTRYASSNLAESTQVDNVVEPPGREGTRRLAVALAEERALSAREAVAAQEAAEAAAAAAAEAVNAAQNSESATEAQPVRMSLMDLLEETDREMGVVGSRYVMGDDDEDYDDDEYCDEVEPEESGGGVVGGGGGVECTCCVCMVRHKGAAFIPCGHTFCRLCSRELWVQRGNCPLCNGFILEILDIF